MPVSSRAVFVVSILAALTASRARAATAYWGGVPGTSADTNWSDAANWPIPPGNWTGNSATYFNQVEFTGVGVNANNNMAVNNVLDATTGVSQVPIWELDYAVTNGNYTTLIAPGVTMSTGAGNGYLKVGADILHTGNPAPANAVETITITGAGGTLTLNPASGNGLLVGQGSASPNDTHNVTLDLSGLDNFVMNPPAGGANSFIFLAASSAARANGVLYLAKTNNIAIGAGVQMCNQSSSSNSLPVVMYLGISNSITTGTTGNFNIGQSGTSTNGAIVEFNPAFLGGVNPPTAFFNSAAAGGRIPNFNICNTSQGFPSYALCNLSGGSVNALVNTLGVGLSGSGLGSATGVLSFDMGTINASSANIGRQQNSGGGMAVGTVNLNSNSTYGASATLTVNGTLSLGLVTGTLTPGSAGTININGGALNAGTITNGGGTSTINCSSGSIAIGGAAGTAAAPISALSVTNSSLTFAANTTVTNAFVTSLVTGGAGNVINISSVPPSASFPVIFRLIQYGSIGGAGYNFSTGTLPALASGYISNDFANSSIDFVLTAGPAALTWNGSISGSWDSSTANWTGGTGVYSDGDFVQFLDGATANNVNLTTTLLPGGITISNTALNYTFSGAGSLGGSYSLIKQGTNVLVLDNSASNTYSGGTTISAGAIQIGNSDANGNLPGSVTDNGLVIFDRNDPNMTLNNAISGSGGMVHAGGGTLRLSGGNTFTGTVLVTNNSTLQLGSGNALGSGTSAAVIASGSTLDVNGYTETKPIIVSGTGVSGSGALINSGGAIGDNPGPGVATNITLVGDATFLNNSPGRWDLGSRNGTVCVLGGAYNLTLNGNSGYFEWANLLVTNVANITVASGNLGVVGSTTFGNPNATLVLTPGATLQLYGANNFVNKQVDLQSGGIIQNSSGNNTMNGAMTLEAGYCLFNPGSGTTLSLSNVLSGSGIFYQNGGTGTTTLWGNSPSFTGGISLYNGTVVLNGLIGCGITSQPGTEVSGSGTATGLVDVSGDLSPGKINGAGTFTAAGGLTLESSATVTMDLAPGNTIGGGTNDLIAITGDLTVNLNNILINPLKGILTNGTYVLMTYTGNLNGFFGSAYTVAPSRYTFTIDTSVGGQVRLNVTGNPNVVAWNNGAGDGTWNVGGSFDWTNLTKNVEDQFLTTDFVLLDDRAPSTGLTIPSGVAVISTYITNNSTANYSITGGGKISGSGSLYKAGPSTLTLSTPNDFSGNFTIAGGTVLINSNTAVAGATNGTLTISNGATLAVNLAGGYPMGNAGFSNRPIVVSGAGANGKGAIQFISSSTPLYSDGNTLGLGQNITLMGDTTISGSNRFDWGYPGAGTTLSSRGSNYNLTVSVGGYSQWYDIGIDTNLGNIDLYTSAGSQAQLAIRALGVSLGNPTNVLTLHSNILFDIQHGDITAGDSGYAKLVHVLPGATWLYEPAGGAGDYRLATSFIMETNSTFNFWRGTNGSGSGTVINGTVQLNDLAHLTIGDNTVTFSNVISGPGGFYFDNYNNTLVFTATNTYQGPTDIRSGMVLSLAGNGSISSSTNIILGSGAVLDVSGRSDQTLTLVLSQMLQGNGAVKGNLVANQALLAPGGVGTIGKLAVTNAITLGGTLFMDINGTNMDQLNCTNGITFGGDLIVSNLGPAFTAGQSFKLFNAGSYTGTFIIITPAPGPGLSWDQSALNTGVIKVIGGAVKPTIGRITISGGNVILSGTNNSGPGGNYSVLTSTNITAPLSNWTVLTNSTFDSNGNFNSTNAMGTNGNQFYILHLLP